MHEVGWHARQDLPPVCRKGHAWETGQMTISWTPCDCPTPQIDPSPDHVVVHCSQLGCTETWQTDTAALFGRPGDRDRRGAADRGRVHAIGLLDTAWTLLMQAPEHHVALLSPAHPGTRRIAELQSWIQDCVTAVDEVQASKTLLAHGGEIAQVEEIADKLATVVDSFQMYASMLERLRASDKEAVGGGQSGSLADVAADQRVVVNCRAATRNSIRRLIAALQADH